MFSPYYVVKLRVDQHWVHRYISMSNLTTARMSYETYTFYNVNQRIVHCLCDYGVLGKLLFPDNIYIVMSMFADDIALSANTASGLQTHYILR